MACRISVERGNRVLRQQPATSALTSLLPEEIDHAHCKETCPSSDGRLKRDKHDPVGTYNSIDNRFWEHRLPDIPLPLFDPSIGSALPTFHYKSHQLESGCGEEDGEGNGDGDAAGTKKAYPLRTENRCRPPTKNIRSTTPGFSDRDPAAPRFGSHGGTAQTRVRLHKKNKNADKDSGNSGITSCITHLQ